MSLPDLKSTDTRTTVLGAIAAALVASQIDYSKLVAGNHTEIVKAVGVVVLAVWGYYTNKP